MHLCSPARSAAVDPSNATSGSPSPTTLADVIKQSRTTHLEKSPFYFEIKISHKNRDPFDELFKVSAHHIIIILHLIDTELSCGGGLRGRRKEGRGQTRSRMLCGESIHNTPALTAGCGLRSACYRRTSRLIALTGSNGSHDTSDTDLLDVDDDRIAR